MTTVDRFNGRLLDVDTATLGDELAADATAGATQITVYDAGAFDEDGGYLRIGGPDGEIVAYTSWDDDTGVITLADALADPWVAGERVDLFDIENGAACAEYLASVLLDDAADGEVGDPITATISYNLIDSLTEGVRSAIGESVVLQREQDGSELEVVDVLGKILIRDITDAIATGPAKPTGLTLDAGVYTVQGRNYGRILASWDPVTTTSAGDELRDLDHYLVQTKLGFPADTTTSWGGDTKVPANVTDVRMEPFLVGRTYSVRLAAVNEKQVAGPWSDVGYVDADEDAIAPGVPSTPTTSSRLGTVKIQWDGLTNTGALMPADFDHVEIHASTTASFVPTPGGSTLIDQINNPAGGYGIHSMAPNGYNTTWYYRLIAVDTSGNASAPSVVANNVVKPLVDVTNFPDDAMEVLYARTGHFIHLTAANFEANLITADFLDIGSLYGVVVTGMVLQTDPTTDLAGNPLPLRGIKLKTNELVAYNSSSQVTFRINASTGAVTMLGSLTSGSTITGASMTASTFTSTNGSGGYAEVSGGVVRGVDFSGFQTFRADWTGVRVYDGGVSVAGLNDAGEVFGDKGIFDLYVSTGAVFASGLYRSSIQGGLDVYSGLAVQSGGISIVSGGLSVVGTTSTFSINATGTITASSDITGAKLTLTSPNTGDTGEGSALRIRDSGVVIKITSSQRYKTDIEPLEIDLAAAYAVTAMSYHRIDADRPGMGFIAELLEAAGFGRFVGRDDYDRPDTVNYEAFSALVHQTLIQDLNARLTAEAAARQDLERRLAVLESI